MQIRRRINVDRRFAIIFVVGSLKSNFACARPDMPDITRELNYVFHTNKMNIHNKTHVSVTNDQLIHYFIVYMHFVGVLKT